MTEPDEFRRFVDVHIRTLLRAGWLLTGEWSAAEDLVQEALTIAWMKWDRASAAASPEAYVRTILVNRFMKSRKRRWIGEVTTDPMPEGQSADVDRIEERQTLAQALSKLPRGQRGALVLRYFLDLTEAQTAEAMGCSVGTVKSHTARGLARLRAMRSVVELQVGS